MGKILSAHELKLIQRLDTLPSLIYLLYNRLHIVAAIGVLHSLLLRPVH